MDTSTVRAIVGREIEPLLRRLGVPHWHVRVVYRPEGPDDRQILRRGECDRFVDYNHATISMNPEAFETEEDVLDTLRHEVFHIVLASFDVFLHAVMAAVECEAQRRTLRSVWTHAAEQGVVALGRMYFGMSKDPGTNKGGSDMDIAADLRDKETP